MVNTKKDEKYWREKLSPEQFKILREGATEKPYSGKHYENHEDGMYHCGACDAPLFSSETKFESDSGWPSFYKPEDNVETREDNSHGMKRTEVVCKKCGSHLGHVFKDGPGDKTGLRYCINSGALGFKKKNGFALIFLILAVAIVTVSAVFVGRYVRQEEVFTDNTNNIEHVVENEDELPKQVTVSSFSSARDIQRRSDLLAITNAISQYVSESNGNLPSNFPTTPTCIGTSLPCFDLGNSGTKYSIVPTYIAVIPDDPLTGSSADTGYTIQVSANGNVVVSSKGELTPVITVTR